MPLSRPADFENDDFLDVIALSSSCREYCKRV